MSHFSVVKCVLKNVNINTLKQALKLMGFTDIKENAEIRDYFGRTTVCDLVIPTSSGGVGIKITKNGIEVITDQFYTTNREIAQRLNENINQYYTTAAFQFSLQKLGYKVAVENKKDKILVHAF